MVVYLTIQYIAAMSVITCDFYILWNVCQDIKGFCFSFATIQLIFNSHPDFSLLFCSNCLSLCLGKVTSYRYLQLLSYSYNPLQRVLPFSCPLVVSLLDCWTSPNNNQIYFCWSLRAEKIELKSMPKTRVCISNIESELAFSPQHLYYTFVLPVRGSKERESSFYPLPVGSTLESQVLHSPQILFSGNSSLLLLCHCCSSLFGIGDLRMML